MKKLILLVAIAAAVPAWGATIRFDTLPSNTDHGTYNGFLGGAIDGVRFDNLICDDYYPTTYVDGRPWNYDMSTLPALTHARFGNVDQYRMAALLLAGDGDDLPGLANAATQSEVSDYQYAIWRLFTPTAPLPGNAGILLMKAEWEDLANPAFGPTYARLRIWTPDGDAATESNQEFLQLTPAAQTPEPGTLGMLAAGVILLGGTVKRRRRP